MTDELKLTVIESAEHDINVYIAKHMQGRIDVIDMHVYLVTQRGYSLATARAATQKAVDALGNGSQFALSTFSPSVLGAGTYDNGRKRTLQRILRWNAATSSRGYISSLMYMGECPTNAPKEAAK